MASVNSPFPPPFSSSLKALSLSAAALNTATHRLTKSIETLDSSLKKLNLGIASWVEISSGSSIDGRFWTKEELGYAKINGKWGLALRASDGDECDLDGEHNTSTEWLFCDASRDLRIRALPFLPQLIAQLDVDAKLITAKISDNVKTAEELADAIEMISRNDLKSFSMESLQQHAVAALLDAKSQSVAADAIGDAAWTLANDTVQIKTNLSKSMLPLVVNSEAVKIIQNAIRECGSEHLKIEFHPLAKPSVKGESK